MNRSTSKDTVVLNQPSPVEDENVNESLKGDKGNSSYICLDKDARPLSEPYQSLRQYENIIFYKPSWSELSVLLIFFVWKSDVVAKVFV